MFKIGLVVVGAFVAGGLADVILTGKGDMITIIIFALCGAGAITQATFIYIDDIKK